MSAPMDLEKNANETAVPPFQASSWAEFLSARDGQDEAIRLSDGLFVFVGQDRRQLPMDGFGWTCLIFDIEPKTKNKRNIARLAIHPISGSVGRTLAGGSICWLVRDDWMKYLGRQHTAQGHHEIKKKYGTYFLPSELKCIGTSALSVVTGDTVGTMYRSAKCLELLSETLRLLLKDELVPFPPGSTISLPDSVRLMEARALIADQYHKKLTIRDIGRSCGLNRSKLTKGFKQLFKATIWEVLTEERLRGAAKELRTSEKSIASIGYEAGYTNIASFTRAFTKKFGYPPGTFRQLHG